MTDWQDRDNGDAVLDGWYAILVSWGTPWEEDTPDVLLFRDGAWVQRQKDCSLPNFYYFQGPFQSSMEARDWGHAHDGVGKYLAERAEEALRARAALEAQSKPQGPTNEDRPMPAAIRDMPEQQQRWYAMGWQAALARFGRPAIEPVPVSDPPEPEDCDEEGRCWGWLNADDGWNLYPVGYLPWWAYWLPHWALPVPVVEGADA